MSALTDTDRHLLAAMDLESLGPTAVGKRFTVAKLRAFLRLRGLPVGGSKSDLALRLVRSEKAARGAAQSAERGETVHLSMGGTIGVSIMACRAEEPAGSDQLTKTGDPDKVTCQACRDSTYYQRNAEGFRRLYQRVQK